MDLLEEMAENSQLTLKIVNIHQSKIDIVKFDSINNFGMWRCEVMNTLMVSNLEDALLLKRKLEETSEKDLDKMNRATCDVIRSC